MFKNVVCYLQDWMFWFDPTVFIRQTSAF